LNRFRLLPNRHSSAFIVLLSVSLSILSGCGSDEDEWTRKRPKVFKAGGTVREAGQPLSGAIVVFHSIAGEVGGRAMTDVKGNYRLTTFKDFDGAVEGEYRVTIEKADWVPVNSGNLDAPDAADLGSGSGPVKKVQLSAEKYADPEKSGFTANITPKGPNRFDFDLEPREK